MTPLVRIWSIAILLQLLVRRFVDVGVHDNNVFLLLLRFV
jgi:hypothetical protein